MSDARKPIPLQPAVVPTAYADGLLKTSDLNVPLSVEVEVWPAAEIGYTLRLELDHVPVTGERVISQNDKPGDILTMAFDPSHLQAEGMYRLRYRTYSPNTMVEDFSPSIPLRVDRTAPGAALLAPLIFPKTTCSGQRIALLPGYAGMEPGDTIATLCNGVSGPRHVVQPDELTVRPIEIVFDHEHLQSLAAESVVIVYTVTDRAGNESIESEPTTLLLTS